jgi:hypothetical protein
MLFFSVDQLWQLLHSLVSTGAWTADPVAIALWQTGHSAFIEFPLSALGKPS